MIIYPGKNEDVKAPEVRKKYGTRAAIVGICCNLIVFALKLAIGMIIKSVSVMADAFNNLADSGSNIVMLIGFAISSKPPDKEHPYGHGRVEYITSLAISIVIIVVAFELFRASVEKIMNPTELLTNNWAFLILIISAVLKISLAIYYKKVGKLINSQTLLTAVFDSFADVVATVVIIISLLVNEFMGKNIDGVAGIFVAVFIFVGGVKLAKEALDLIIGPPIDHELSEHLKKLVMESPEVIDVHDLVVHNYGVERVMATIDIEISTELSITEAHTIIDEIETRVKEQLNIQLVAHIDPVDVGDETTNKYSEIVDKILYEIDTNLNKHNFERHEENGKTTLNFELDIPFSYNGENEANLLVQVKKRVSAAIDNTECIINVDKSFTKTE